MLKEKIIFKKLSELPKKPGCYLFKNNENKIIYIGKAKNIYKRVNQYFQNKKRAYKTILFIDKIFDVDFLLVSTEKDAFLLEQSLIKKYLPKYNILLADDKKYPYILLTNEKFPRLLYVRNIKKDQGIYFGPFPDAYSPRKIYDFLNYLFPLRKCNKLPNKPCLYYSLGQCLAPCINKVNLEEYEKIKEKIISFFKGKTFLVEKFIKDKIKQFIKEENYELCKKYQEILDDINNNIKTTQIIEFKNNLNFDFINYFIFENYISLTIFFYRNGILMRKDNHIFQFFTNYLQELSNYLEKIYQKNLFPEIIYCPQELIDFDEWFLINKSTLKFPKIGKKKEIFQLVYQNAKESFEINYSKKLFFKRVEEKGYDLLKKYLSIKNNLDIYFLDASHHHTDSYCAAFIYYAYQKGFIKNNYRKINLTKTTVNNDLDALSMAIHKYFFEKKIQDPFILIVDGAIAQLNAIKSAFKSFNHFIPVLPIALKKNFFHKTSSLIIDENTEYLFDPKKSEFYFFQNIQEEGHRFAIKYHNYLKTKELFKGK
ncbi:excinuclease ABC subunit C [symbiont of Argiope bruennichi]|uniref:excinuclease ABC subunit UvrC n=1 Tax=symbiont of Argiope bruennichi TaxID=2810479 RepID=UPI003DA4ABEE